MFGYENHHLNKCFCFYQRILVWFSISFYDINFFHYSNGNSNFYLNYCDLWLYITFNHFGWWITYYEVGVFLGFWNFVKDFLCVHLSVDDHLYTLYYSDTFDHLVMYVHCSNLKPISYYYRCLYFRYRPLIRIYVHYAVDYFYIIYNFHFCVNFFWYQVWWRLWVSRNYHITNDSCLYMVFIFFRNYDCFSNSHDMHFYLYYIVLWYIEVVHFSRWSYVLIDDCFWDDFDSMIYFYHLFIFALYFLCYDKYSYENRLIFDFYLFFEILNFFYTDRYSCCDLFLLRVVWVNSFFNSVLIVNWFWCFLLVFYSIIIEVFCLL